DVELLAGGGYHAVAAGHEAGWRGQRHTAGVFEVFAGPQHRLLADHAGAAHLLQAALGIGDPPVPGLELDGLAPEIGDVDRIGPEEIAVLRRRLVRQELRGHLYLDLAGDGAISSFGNTHGSAFGPIAGILLSMFHPGDRLQSY